MLAARANEAAGNYIRSGLISAANVTRNATPHLKPLKINEYKGLLNLLV
jgi:hypothetical protein